VTTAVPQIQAFADDHNIPVSAAIESLALMCGLAFYSNQDRLSLKILEKLMAV
jgi:hypothetical protein